MHRSSPLVTRRHVFLVGAAMASVLGSPNAQEAPVGAIDTLRGNAFAEGSLPRRALQQAAEVFVNDLVETEINSSLTMHLGKATFVKLGALAKFRIDRFVVDAGGSFELEQGPLLIDRDESAKSETLQVRSPFALIAARGTMFFAGEQQRVSACSLAAVLCQLLAAVAPSSSDLALAPISPTLVMRQASPEGGARGGSLRHLSRWAEIAEPPCQNATLCVAQIGSDASN